MSDDLIAELEEQERRLVFDRFDFGDACLAGRRLAARGQQLDAAMGVDPAKYAAHGGAFPSGFRTRG